MPSRLGVKVPKFDKADMYVYRLGFSLPPLQSRLEKLMGTNVVRLTDRNYMLSLRRKIQEEYEDTVRQRIQSREQAEIDRQKKLILDGKMSFSDAPSELTNHPVFKITQFTHQMLDERKLKSRRVRRTVHHPNNHGHSGPDKPSSGHRLAADTSPRRPSSCPPTVEPDASPTEDVLACNGKAETGESLQRQEENSSDEPEFVFTQEQFDRLRYETEAVKYLRGLEWHERRFQTVTEIYEVASRIVGDLQLYNVQAEEVVGCTTLGINIP